LGARVGAQSAYELGQLAMVLDAPEARGGAEQAEAGPAVNHVADAPALHIARDVAERGDEILDAVRGGEEAAQPRRQVELEYRHRLLQPFAETSCGVGCPLLSSQFVRVCNWRRAPDARRAGSLGGLARVRRDAEGDDERLARDVDAVEEQRHEVELVQAAAQLRCELAARGGHGGPPAGTLAVG